MEDTVSILKRVMRQAGSIVAEAELPDALRRHAFQRAVDVLLAEAAVDGLARPARQDPPAVVGATSGPTDGDARDPLERVAGRAGIAEPAVKEIYRFEQDQVSLVVGERKLDGNKATGARQITLLVAGGRQAAEFEEWTNLARAREVCAVYHRLDSKNYAATVKSMSGVFNFHGQGVHREVRLTMPGWDEWAELVRQLIMTGGGR